MHLQLKDSQFQTITARQPEVIIDYNTFMTSIDKSDQLMNKYAKKS